MTAGQGSLAHHPGLRWLAVSGLLTLAIAVFKATLVVRLRRLGPQLQPAGAWLMVVAGAYIVFYWLTVGELL